MEDKLVIQPSFWEEPEKKIKQEITPVSLANDGTTIESWIGGVHPDGFLEFSKGFYLYADKLSRMLAYLEHNRDENERLYGQLASITGLSESRVEALVQYAVYMQLLVPRTLFPTPLCRLVLSQDPFFDHNGTLWLLHYLLASNPLLVVWNYMCNAVLPAVAEIQKGEAAERFMAFSGRWSDTSLQKKTRKELRAFFAVYTEEMFAPIAYLRQVKPLVYAPTRDVAPVPKQILFASALVYRDRFHPGASGVEIPTLVHADNSPGRLMRQREAYIRKALDNLHEAGLLTIESKANLDQIRYKSSVTWLDAVWLYYQNSNP
jgi:hypothetical protein